MLDIIVFNVEHGQSIFVYPQGAPEYGMLIDCGNTSDFNPIDLVIQWKLLPIDPTGRYVLRNLALTNYDHDHFSGLPYLRSRVHIATTFLAPNVSASELLAIKPEKTEALEHLCYLKNTYTGTVQNYAPPYRIVPFSLTKNQFLGEQWDTNNLSQVIFVQYGGSTICVCGDLEKAGWERMLQNVNFRSWLQSTDILVAAHHGRENGHAEEIFGFCKPECVILSDKAIVHRTQEGMAQAYASRTRGDGVTLVSAPTVQRRKVLTTRNDGHIWVQLAPGNGRIYRTL